MKIDKNRIKKNLIKIGLDASAIVVLGIASVAASELITFLKDLEVFIAVSSGIWLYVPFVSFISKKLEK